MRVLPLLIALIIILSWPPRSVIAQDIPTDEPCATAPDHEICEAELPLTQADIVAQGGGIFVLDDTLYITVRDERADLVLVFGDLQTPLHRVDNADWTPVIEVFDGIPMAFVPAGCFTMGADDGRPNERPAHELCIDDPYWIDVTEASNLQFGSYSFSPVSYLPAQPRNLMTWGEALYYCESRGGALPTEAQWEYAARGPDGLRYPWGDNFMRNGAIYDAVSDGETAPIGSRPLGASWVGALDMAGNVSEWTRTIYDDTLFSYPYHPTDGREDLAAIDVERVVRGGSYLNNPYNLRATNRDGIDQDTGVALVGVRCVLPVDVGD